MSRVFIIGAGFSKSYNASFSKKRMPIASDFFKTYYSLDISKNLWVKIGRIVNYVQETRNIIPEELEKFEEDIEEFHSEVAEKLDITKNKEVDAERLTLLGLFNEIIFLFSSVIN